MTGTQTDRQTNTHTHTQTNKQASKQTNNLESGINSLRFLLSFLPLLRLLSPLILSLQVCMKNLVQANMSALLANRDAYLHTPRLPLPFAALDLPRDSSVVCAMNQERSLVHFAFRSVCDIVSVLFFFRSLASCCLSLLFFLASHLHEPSEIGGTLHFQVSP